MTTDQYPPSDFPEPAHTQTLNWRRQVYAQHQYVRLKTSDRCLVSPYHIDLFPNHSKRAYVLQFLIYCICSYCLYLYHCATANTLLKCDKWISILRQLIRIKYYGKSWSGFFSRGKTVFALSSG